MRFLLITSKRPAAVKRYRVKLVWIKLILNWCWIGLNCWGFEEQSVPTTRTTLPFNRPSRYAAGKNNILPSDPIGVAILDKRAVIRSTDQWIRQSCKKLSSIGQTCGIRWSPMVPPPIKDYDFPKSGESFLLIEMNEDGKDQQVPEEKLLITLVWSIWPR